MVDITQTAANVALVSGTASQGTAAESIAPGNVLYTNSTTLVVGKFDANATATAVLAGIAISYAAVDEIVTYAGPGCVVDVGGTLGIGLPYVGSATAGGLAPHTDLASGMWSVIIGHATTATNLQIDPTSATVVIP